MNEVDLYTFSLLQKKKISRSKFCKVYFCERIAVCRSKPFSTTLPYGVAAGVA